VDTGCTEPDARLKELRAFVSPAEMLARVRVSAAEVPVTLVSHLHWDHWGGYPYFPGSTFWMQREELEFWTGVAGQHENYRSFALPESLAQLVRLNSPTRRRCWRASTPSTRSLAPRTAWSSGMIRRSPRASSRSSRE
jgi:glyoxylase-like metal-dependent hydrolase (beta-lactamase superfamily II)